MTTKNNIVLFLRFQLISDRNEVLQLLFAYQIKTPIDDATNLLPKKFKV